MSTATIFPEGLDEKYRKNRNILMGLFVLYVLFLTKLLLFKYVTIVDLLSQNGDFIRSVNLVPFYSIHEYYFSGMINSSLIANINILGNIAIFIPLGVYASIYFKDYRIKHVIIGIICSSIAVEVVQYLFAIGVTDIDDVILNSIGGAFGVIIHRKLLFTIGENRKIHQLMIWIALVLIVLFLITTLAVSAQGII